MNKLENHCDESKLVCHPFSSLGHKVWWLCCPCSGGQGGTHNSASHRSVGHCMCSVIQLKLGCQSFNKKLCSTNGGLFYLNRFVFLDLEDEVSLAKGVGVFQYKKNGHT